MEQRTDFPLGGAAPIGAYKGAVIGLGIACVIFGAFLLGAGEVTVTTAVLAVAFSLLMGGVFYWGISSSGKGIARLTDRGLALQGGAYTDNRPYKWADIADVEIEGDSRLRRARDPGPAIIKLSFSRSLKYSPIGGKAVTDAFGIPIPLLRSIRFAVQEPDAFVAAVKERLYQLESVP